jgi:tRNA (guanine-N7-)-methyltransferase
MTAAQRRALEVLWRKYGLDVPPPSDGPGTPAGPRSALLDLDSVFGRQAPRVLEIGFGMGEALLDVALAQPEVDFLGVEVYRPGIGSCLRRIEAESIPNVRLVAEDAVRVLECMIPDASLARVQLFFPDPWPKKRHHKRRLVQPAFVALVARKLARGGIFHMATDWEHYAHHMLEVMVRMETFCNCAAAGGFAPRPTWRPRTKFEQRGERLGHAVWDLVFERI